MKSIGIHLIVDAWGAPKELLDDPKAVRRILEEAVAVGEATLVDLCVHKFSPQGVTATATLAESHIALHTWPEHGYFAVDLFFCGKGDPYPAMDFLRRALGARRVKVTELRRGLVTGAARPEPVHDVS